MPLAAHRLATRVDLHPAEFPGQSTNQVAVAGLSGAVNWGEVNTKTMRKIFSLSMVALLALTFALSALGCGKKEEAPAASTEQMMPPADSTAAPADTTAPAAGATDTTAAKK
jgi:hypothetical protein